MGMVMRIGCDCEQEGVGAYQCGQGWTKYSHPPNYTQTQPHAPGPFTVDIYDALEYYRNAVDSRCIFTLVVKGEVLRPLFTTAVIYRKA
jgi:hypothetical protein